MYVGLSPPNVEATTPLGARRHKAMSGGGDAREVPSSYVRCRTADLVKKLFAKSIISRVNSSDSLTAADSLEELTSTKKNKGRAFKSLPNEDSICLKREYRIQYLFTLPGRLYANGGSVVAASRKKSFLSAGAKCSKFESFIVYKKRGASVPLEALRSETQGIRIQMTQLDNQKWKRICRKFPFKKSRDVTLARPVRSEKASK
ncbi:unnamed protein product [Clavelina lepadiformis]|uniref:Uncharacterized protein n=1 Tax=Clavelina lepadiformis TaxID=159417 RepID=A0ABP0GTK4_CLALP